MRSIAVRMGVLLQDMQGSIASSTLPEFGNRPENLRIDWPRRISHPECIFLGDDIRLGPDSLLVAVTQYPSLAMRHPGREEVLQRFSPRISIGNRVTATAGLQVAAMSEVVIEDDVMFASNINITDGLHGYDHPGEPYKYQPMTRISPIRVGRGCWIGQNVVVLPGVTIGEYSIVGANSVVTRSIPDRCIAVGAPARVIKQWDRERSKWLPARAETLAPVQGEETFTVVRGGRV